MGAQAERAVNTGWVLDQRADGAGAFITNNSPTSSGLTIKSTGDATAFYLTGRVLQIVQAAGTALCTVGLSTFSGGITNIFLTQFSTAAGLSTAASTGVITTVSASPMIVGSTNSNFSGGAYWNPSTGGVGSLLSFVGTGPAIAIGDTSATVGTIRIPTLGSLQARNGANNGNGVMIAAAAAGVDVGDATVFPAVRIADANTAAFQNARTSVADGTGHLLAAARFWGVV